LDSAANTLAGMRAILLSLLSIAVSAFNLRQVLALENPAVHQQLAIYEQTDRRPYLRTTYRLPFGKTSSRMVKKLMHALCGSAFYPSLCPSGKYR
jgi:uncharacterized membrane protein affecting hemolysin expression